MRLDYGNFEHEPTTWTVEDLTSYIRELIDIDYRLQDLWVSGEISNFMKARSGHLYFTLKDNQAQLKCVMWSSIARKLGYLPENGDEVTTHGRISVYETGGIYQLYADSIAPLGRGNLALEFERLKSMLATEGCFNEEFKKTIPPYPTKIGIVTSVDAAALRDILNVLERRWPGIQVILAPSLVQGHEAPVQIVSALERLDGRDDIDTVIVARGGGSMEDLWSFNDEKVARAIFAARHPIIVGIGHETDFTIADFVADVRAPTPSAAAELAVPDQRVVIEFVDSMNVALGAQIRNSIEDKALKLEHLFKNVSHLSPRVRIENISQTLDWHIRRLDDAITKKVEMDHSIVSMAAKGLESLNPLATIARGYAIVQREDRRIVKQTVDVVSGDELRIKVSDGDIAATVK